MAGRGAGNTPPGTQQCRRLTSKLGFISFDCLPLSSRRPFLNRRHIARHAMASPPDESEGALISAVASNVHCVPMCVAPAHALNDRWLCVCTCTMRISRTAALVLPGQCLHSSYWSPNAASVLTGQCAALALTDYRINPLFHSAIRRASLVTSDAVSIVSYLLVEQASDHQALLGSSHVPKRCIRLGTDLSGRDVPALALRKLDVPLLSTSSHATY